MSDLRTAAQQALEALEAMNPYPASKEDQRAGALTALRAALAQQAEPVEPVAWAVTCYGMVTEKFQDKEEAENFYRAMQAIYPQEAAHRKLISLSPDPSQRKPLTEEEIESCRQKGYAHAGLGAPFDFGKAARAVEKASWEKNHG